MIRMLDARIEREDVSAKLWGSLFGAAGLIPTPLDIDKYLDSDEAAKLAHRYGYKGSLSDMYVQLASDDVQKNEYTPSAPTWYIVQQGGFNYRTLNLDAVDGKVVKNDF